MKEIEKLVDKAIAEMNKKITDEIFLIIEKDEVLKKEYESLKKKKRKRTVNTTIGKLVRKKYNLSYEKKNRQNSPESILIKSHQKFN